MANDLNPYKAMVRGTLLFENDKLASKQNDEILT